jgi:hypothetical protein
MGVSDRDRLVMVLDPGFVRGLDELSLNEVRERRDQALAQREYLSYLRRLLQVRLDLLSAERERRATGDEAVPLVDRLAAVLTDDARTATSRGEAVRTGLPATDVSDADERASSILGPIGLSDPENLDDEQLSEAIELLQREERAVSADRAAVLAVHDRLQEELKRRFREDPGSVTREG